MHTSYTYLIGVGTWYTARIINIIYIHCLMRKLYINVIVFSYQGYIFGCHTYSAQMSKLQADQLIYDDKVVLPSNGEEDLCSHGRKCERGQVCMLIGARWSLCAVTA